MIFNIDKENRKGVVNLHKSVYKIDCVKESCEQFKDFFSYSLSGLPNYIVVNVSFNDDVDCNDVNGLNKICLEFLNYLFMLMKNKDEV